MTPLEKLTVRMGERAARVVLRAYALGVRHGRALERIAQDDRMASPAEARMLSELGLR